MSGKRILLIEDEEKIRVLVKKYLEQEGFEVLTEEDGDKARETLNNIEPDLILLDLMLPEMNGLDLCREIRKTSCVPIIMLTAKTQETDKILGLEMGADDYITKPFSLAELTARVRAALRRSDFDSIQKEETIIKGDLHIHIDRCQVKLRGKDVSLTATEFKILALLAQNPGRVYSRLQILNAALGESFGGYERSIDTHISNMRHKIEKNPAEPGFIKTVYGLGYKFDEQ